MSGEDRNGKARGNHILERGISAKWGSLKGKERNGKELIRGGGEEWRGGEGNERGIKNSTVGRKTKLDKESSERYLFSLSTFRTLV